MVAVDNVVLQLRDPDGHMTGSLTIAILPTATGHQQPPLLVISQDDDDMPTEPVQLLEQQEYTYLLRGLPDNSSLLVEPAELFSPDDASRLHGRLRTSFHVGGLPIYVRVGGNLAGSTAVEVRSKKLDYLTDFRWMLRDLADDWAELLMEAFAPTEQYFTARDNIDAPTAYQRFAFIQSQLRDETFIAALGYFRSHPDHEWQEDTELRAPLLAGSMGSTLARRMCSGGPRSPWREHPAFLPNSLPRQLPNTRRIETVDTPANRFVKFALLRWRDIAALLGDAITRDIESYRKRRALAEIQDVLDQLDQVLAEGVLRDVSRLTHFPAGSQVLQKKEGYRDIYRAYIQFESAAQLWWTGGDQIYGAGQRNVAALYEYWVYMQLVKAVRGRCLTFDSKGLVKVDPRGFGVTLRRGEESLVAGTASRLGRVVGVELWFNHSFSASSHPPSWSRPMRPDYSLRLTAEVPHASFEEVWLHFDAKYRAQDLAALFGSQVVDATEVGVSKVAAGREDLLKMHAYKDAIQRSAGSFVLYPGTEQERRPQFRELIPGLGAFVLRPSETGLAIGIDQLGSFVDDVVQHFASVVSQERRGRYWKERIFGLRASKPARSGRAPIEDLPPADTLVLLAYVRGQRHLEWIHSVGRYNLRADGARRGALSLNSRELGADLLLLYGPHMKSGELWTLMRPPEIWMASDLLHSGYGRPTGQSYFCLVLGERLVLDAAVNTVKLERVRTDVHPTIARGAPVAVTWDQLL